MAKERLSFKDGRRFCYSVKENSLKDFYNKIIEISTISEDDYLVELRLDFLINKKYSINDIVDCIIKAKKYLSVEKNVRRQFIATIRHFSSGGNCIISDREYLDIVEYLSGISAIDAIDIDYEFYDRKSASIKKLFSDKLFLGRKTLIITYTCRDKCLSKEEYNEIFRTLAKTPAYIIKIVTRAFSTIDAENLMTAAKAYDSELKKKGKLAVVISTGKLGILSRVWHEYTNTMIVYLDAYELDMVPLGEINIKIFDKCRKLLCGLNEFSHLDASMRNEN